MTGKVCSSSKSLKTELVGIDVFQKCPQRGNVPLPVAQLVDEPVLGLFRRDLERLVESAVRGLRTRKRRVQHQERLAHRVHDVLCVGLDVFD